MSAFVVFETAPLGAIINFSNGAPKPPERFRKKLAEWERHNGSGRLISRTPGCTNGSYSTPDTFTLHQGDFGSGGVIVMRVHSTYSVTSLLNFSIASLPQRGQVLIVTRYKSSEELRHLAASPVAANAWLATNRYSDAVMLEVQSDGSHRDITPQAAAA